MILKIRLSISFSICLCQILFQNYRLYMQRFLLHPYAMIG